MYVGEIRKLCHLKTIFDLNMILRYCHNSSLFNVIFKCDNSKF